jgi:hypothetical protein
MRRRPTRAPGANASRLPDRLGGAVLIGAGVATVQSS